MGGRDRPRLLYYRLAEQTIFQRGEDTNERLLLTMKPHSNERIYKSRDSASSLFRSAESAAGTVGEEGGSRKGERQAAVTSAVQEPGYLFIRYLFSSSSPPKPFPSPLLFFFLFGRLKISGKREESCFRSFSLPHLLSSPTFPSSAFSSQLGEVLPGGRPDGV